MKSDYFLVGAMLFAGLLSVFISNTPGNAQEQEIAINRAGFCTAIKKNREPLRIEVDSIHLAEKREIFFWMEFQGGATALEALKDKGQLLLRHQWRRGVIWVTDNIEVGITTDKWREHQTDIRSQVQQKGFFTYRTYSSKANWEYGDTYEVITLDRNGKGVCKFGENRLFRPQISLEMP